MRRLDKIKDKFEEGFIQTWDNLRLQMSLEIDYLSR